MLKEINPDFNFKDPLELVKIWRDPIYDKTEKQDDENEEDDFSVKVFTRKITDWVEHSCKIWIQWENIEDIKQFNFKDDWKKYKGKKYFISLYGKAKDYLIFGDVQEIIAYWTMYLNTRE